MATITPLEGMEILAEAGFGYGKGIVIMHAIAHVESPLYNEFGGFIGFNSSAKNEAGNTPPSTDRGWLQINSYWHSEVSDQCAYDPLCAARAAFRITEGGTKNFSQWAAYGSQGTGPFRRWMSYAWEIFDLYTAKQNNASLRKELDAANRQITTLNATIATRTTERDAARTELATTKATLTSTQASLATCQGSLSDANSKLVAANARVTSLESSIETLEERISKKNALLDQARAV